MLLFRFLSFSQLGGFMYIMVKEAAARLKISRQWVNTLIKKGKIATTILAGRRVVIADKAFQALEKARRKAGK
jgi:excisionase family DNA binding protein